MSSAADRGSLRGAGAACAAAAIERWRHLPASSITHHGRRCCAVAREWVFSTDYSQLNGGDPLTGPRWLRHRYSWGPSPWPMRWCEAVERKTLDCGALASLAHEVFTARGVKSYPAQLIQQYSGDAARHWRMRWDGDSCPADWIEDELIYHEGCAVVARGDEIKVWDASAGWWIDPKQSGGYGGLLALRIFAAGGEQPAAFRWGRHRVAPNLWQQLDGAHAGSAR